MTPMLRPQNLLLCPVGHYNCGYGGRQPIYHSDLSVPLMSSMSTKPVSATNFAIFEMPMFSKKKNETKPRNRLFSWLTTYHERSKRIDVLARVLFPFGFLAFNFVYWSYYLLTKPKWVQLTIACPVWEWFSLSQFRSGMLKELTTLYSFFFAFVIECLVFFIVCLECLAPFSLCRTPLTVINPAQTVFVLYMFVLLQILCTIILLIEKDNWA